MPFTENQRDIIHSKMYSFNKYLCDTYNISGSILGTDDTAMKETEKEIMQFQHWMGRATDGKAQGIIEIPKKGT